MLQVKSIQLSSKKNAKDKKAGRSELSARRYFTDI
jgi:hypothetical protein